MGPPLIDDFAAIAPRVSGSISFVSSSLIIYLIRRSKTKFSIIYHRIMFGMSTADILSSFAMALTTLPMVKSGDRSSYQNAGIELGNIHTCRAQGFTVTFGLWCMMAYNGSLCVYYACAIGFQMKEVVIQRKVEPYLHIVAIACGLIPSVLALSIDYINNSGYDAWCTVTPPPGSSFPFYKIIGYVILIPMSLLFLSILGSFVLILLRVHRIEKQMQTGISNVGQNHSIQRRSPVVMENLRKAEKSHSNSKILFRHALAYILAMMTSTSMAYLRQVPYFKKGSVHIDDKILVCLLPLQGFFNFLIFVAHKVNNYRRRHPNVSRLTVLKMMFFGADEVDDEILFSRISLVSINENKEIEKIYLSNEFEDEEYDLSYGSDHEEGNIDERQDVYEDNHDLDCDEEIVQTQPFHDSIHQGLGQVVSRGDAGGSLVSNVSQSSRGVKSSFGLSDGLSLGISTLDSGEKRNQPRQSDGNSFLKGLQHANSILTEGYRGRRGTSETKNEERRETTFDESEGRSLESQNVASSSGSSKSWFLDRMGFGVNRS